jgi:hypothetical protein
VQQVVVVGRRLRVGRAGLRRRRDLQRRRLWRGCDEAGWVSGQRHVDDSRQWDIRAALALM